MLQAGVAAGFVLGRAVIRDIVPMEHAASMIGYVTMAMTIMPMLAPAIGGILEEQLNWRYSLRLMYLMGIISLLLIWFDQKETLITKMRHPVQNLVTITKSCFQTEIFGFTLSLWAFQWGPILVF